MSAAISPLRAVIIGAGPAGFYTADQLLNEGFEVDLLDALPTPFGLVRAGVAPDHPKIKSVTRIYDKTAAREGFRFFGGIRLGEHLSRQDLLRRYHAVVYATGTGAANRLGIPGEDRPGSVAATRFVAWYNGHPEAADDTFDLSMDRVVVVGNGNVAIDVARMLVLDSAEIDVTDTADHALDALRPSGVREVVVLGRRGPAQAAFTNPEVRELGELRRADIDVRLSELEGAEPEDTRAQRNLELLRGYAERPGTGASHTISLRFLRSPVEILGAGDDGPVTGVRVAVNRLDGGRPVPTGEVEEIPCGMVVRSIGYRGVPMDDVPFDERRGLIRNTGGRVCDDEERPHPGEYVAGWIKRGPSGVIGTNKKDAADTVARIRDDREAGRLATPEEADAEATAAFFDERAPHAVTWAGWQLIDAHERRIGEQLGRPRRKLVRLHELLETGRRVKP